jgi:histidinol-phosphatase
VNNDDRRDDERPDVPSPYDDDLALALELADLADAITVPYYRNRSFTVRHKDDRSEVTEADRSTEAALRARLRDARPDHAVLGEEEGLVGPADAAYRWIIDPIDSTSNFVKNVPIWATLVALEHDGRLVVGVCSAPALDRRWWAVLGGGAFANGHPIHVSDVAAVADAHLGYSDIGSFVQHGRGAQLADLAARCWRGRGLGDFWVHMLVAEGAMDAAAEAIVNLWDVAAVQVIVEEAGGRFTDLAGERTADGGSALSSNGRLHAEILRSLAVP